MIRSSQIRSRFQIKNPLTFASGFASVPSVTNVHDVRNDHDHSGNARRVRNESPALTDNKPGEDNKLVRDIRRPAEDNKPEPGKLLAARALR
jgi:hypothetical protein